VKVKEEINGLNSALSGAEEEYHALLEQISKEG
jgi:hypothetical protein